MDSMQRKKNAAAFAAEWSGRGYEKGDAQVFWTELLQQIVGMRNISRNVRSSTAPPPVASSTASSRTRG